VDLGGFFEGKGEGGVIKIGGVKDLSEIQVFDTKGSSTTIRNVFYFQEFWCAVRLRTIIFLMLLSQNIASLTIFVVFY